MDKLKEIFVKIKSYLPSEDGLVGKSYKLLNKIILASLVIFLISWWQFDRLAGFLVNTQDIKQHIEKLILDTTGKTAKVEGEITFVTSPEPEIVVRKINIQNAQGAFKESFAQIDFLKTSPNLFQLILGNITFKTIYLENVILNIEKHEEQAEAVKSFSTAIKNGNFLDKDVKFKNIEINRIKKSLKSENLIERKLFFTDLEYNPDEKNAKGQVIKGTITDQVTKETFIFLFDFEDGLFNQTPVKARIYSDTSELALDGTANFSENPSLDFKLTGKIKNFSKKFFAIIGIADEFVEAIKEGEEASFNLAMKYENNNLDVSNFSAVSNYITLNSKINSAFDIRTKHTINIDIDFFDYANSFRSIKETSDGKKITKLERSFQDRLNSFFLFSVGDDVDFDVNFTVKSINYSDSTKGALVLKANYLDSKFKLEKFLLTLPAGSGFTCASEIEVDQANKTMKGGLAFKLLGKNLNNLIIGLNLSSNKNDDGNLGVFSLDGKAYLYGKQVHFRELTGKIDDNLVAGQLLINYANEFNADSAFNFNKLELDKFITDKKPEEIIDDSFASRLDVLRYLDSIFDHLNLSINSDNLTKSGEKLEEFSMFAKIVPGVTEIKDFFFKTKITGEIKGSATFDITDFQPKAKFDIKMENFDFDLVSSGKLNPENDKYNFNGKWSKEKISFEKLNSFDGTIKIEADKFKLYHLNFENLRASMETAGGKTIIKEARVDNFGTKIDIEGEVTNDYPSFSFSFIATNIDIIKFMNDTFKLQNVAGKFNASGNLSSTGYSLEEFAKNLRGRFNLVTRNFAVRGFDLVGLSKALPTIKRIEQAEATGKVYLNKNTSEFGALSTAIDISGGKITFSNVELLNPVLQKTFIAGFLDISNWTLEVTSNLSLMSDDRILVNIPLKTSSAKLPETTLNWDYKGIVKYWEDKFYAGKLN